MSEQEAIHNELSPKDLEKVFGGASTDPLTADLASASVPLNPDPGSQPCS